MPKPPMPAKTVGWRAVIERPGFSRYYALGSVGVLFLTSLFWSIKGAVLQLSNADQLVDPYLFENYNTFHHAIFPAAHSFLLKWPLFWLVKLFGFSNLAFTVCTVLLVGLTLAGIVWLLYKIERRPLIFGTLCLALASVLLLVPAQPAPGNILPVNMAMLTTRNLEYLLYVFSLACLVKSPSWRSAKFWLALAGLSTLIASDRLFLYIGAGGAITALVAYSLSHARKLTDYTAKWLVLTLAAFLVALAALGLIGSTLTNLSHGGQSGPYSLVSSFRSVGLGVFYAATGLLSNFGANAAFGTTVIRHVPLEFIKGLLGWGGPAYLVNLVVFLAGLYMSGRLLWLSFVKHKTAKLAKHTPQVLLAIMLLWSSMVALLVFVATNHYYASDARYLSIWLVSVFIAAAVYTSSRKWRPDKVVLVGLALAVSLVFGIFQANHISTVEQQALSNINQRNSIVAHVLQQRHSQVLLGDYWRVLPIKQVASGSLTVVPLSDCLNPETVLSSKAWRPDLHNQSFAYLLTFDRSLTGSSGCSLQQIVAAYGRPNSSALIAGSLDKPVELVLFYDHGIHTNLPPVNYIQPKSPAAVVPVTLSELPNAACAKPTLFTVVAHEDDDLLFTNPDLLHAIRRGDCIRTVFITAGDAGNGQFYWLGREQGSEAAYSHMLGDNDIWVQRIVQLSKHRYISVASPRNNLTVSLIFMHLSDGNLNGEGFKASGYASLAKLDAGKINLLYSADKQSEYTAAQLTDTLLQLMDYYQPTEVHTQSNLISKTYPDHSDHMAAGRFTTRAFKQYESARFNNSVALPIKYYVGYPVHQLPPNVSGTDLGDKVAAFFAYAQYDGAVCRNLAQCKDSSTLGTYLQRQYTNPY